MLHVQRSKTLSTPKPSHTKLQTFTAQFQLIMEKTHDFCLYYMFLLCSASVLSHFTNMVSHDLPVKCIFALIRCVMNDIMLQQIKLEIKLTCYEMKMFLLFIFVYCYTFYIEFFFLMKLVSLMRCPQSS